MTKIKIGLWVFFSIVIIMYSNINLNAQSDEISDLIDKYTKELGSPHDVVRLNAVKALSKILDKRVVNPLIKSLEDENKFVRKEACHGLGMLKHPRAVDPLGMLLLEEVETYVKLECAWALGNMDFAEALPYLYKQLEREKKMAVRNEIKKAIKVLEN